MARAAGSVAGAAPRAGVVTAPTIERKLRRRTKAGTQDSRVHNRALVLQTLYRRGPMTRSELAKASELTAPTISALVAEMEADGLLVDIGPRAGSRVGKPATVVRIDDGAMLTMALDLSPAGRFSGALVDLRGRVVQRRELPVGEARGDDALAVVLRLADELAAAAGKPLLGVGIASPGIIDDEGVVRIADHLGWTDLPLGRLLSDRLGVAGYVGNDVNVAALGVHHFHTVTRHNVMVVAIENGVGVGLIVGGQLVEGEQFAAGEIGHVTVEPDGPECVCGRRGCLDVMISAAHLAGRYERARPEERSDVLRAAGRALGAVLAPIVSVLNLKEVVVTGPASLVDGPMLAAAQQTVADHTLPAITGDLAIRSMAKEKDLTIQGCTSLVLAGELGVL